MLLFALSKIRVLSEQRSTLDLVNTIYCLKLDWIELNLIVTSIYVFGCMKNDAEGKCVVARIKHRPITIFEKIKI